MGNKPLLPIAIPCRIPLSAYSRFSSDNATPCCFPRAGAVWIMLRFYQDVLGFELSDYMLRPFKIYFFHVNPRHHSFAVLETGRNGIHHLMVELFMLDDVGQAYDLALREERRIAATLGRHTNDYMTSFYSRTPSDFLVEYGWGGRSVDPKSWTPVEMTHGPSLWGHERAWIPADELAEARDMRARVALEGQRAPVQVIEGNYTLAPGTCPWWDATKARSPHEGSPSRTCAMGRP